MTMGSDAAVLVVPIMMASERFRTLQDGGSIREVKRLSLGTVWTSGWCIQ